MYMPDIYPPDHKDLNILFGSNRTIMPVARLIRFVKWGSFSDVGSMIAAARRKNSLCTSKKRRGTIAKN